MTDDRAPDGPLHWASALLAAMVVLALAVPVLGVAAPWERAKRKPSPYAMTNSLKGKAIISATAVVPGQSGRGKVVISNTGTRPFRSVKLTQAKSSNPIGPGLELQVFDSTTKRCLYPLPKLPKPKRGRPAPKPPRTCTAWAPWTAGGKLRNLAVPPTRGKTWRPRERHVVHVLWRLRSDAPQGVTASFNLTWRASA